MRWIKKCFEKRWKSSEKRAERKLRAKDKNGNILIENKEVELGPYMI